MSTFLTEFVRTIIIMSISGGAVALLLLIIRPFVRHRLPKTAQYYFWMVALIAFLVPMSRIFVMPERVDNVVPVSVNVFTVAESNTMGISIGPLPVQPPHLAPPTVPAAPVTIPGTAPTVPVYEPTYMPPAGIVVDSTALLLVYPWIALAVLMYNLIGYGVFAKKLRRRYIPARDEEVELLQRLCFRAHVRLFRSKTAATPMLIGLFRPTIVLPDRDYTPAQLQSILLHELTHMRRFDIAVKWLSLLACALHWFNPFVWLARREINRTCELSCDEAVIRNMNAGGKQDYGNTLIDVATNTKIPMPVLSTTMCQEKRALKERLTSIMKSRRHTKLAVFVSMLIILAAVLAACTLGASRNPADPADPADENGTYENVNENDSSFAEILATPTTPLEYALLHIENVAASIHGSPYVRVVDTRIDIFEKVAALDEGFPFPVELWKLEFAIRVEEDSDDVRWGTYWPCEDGWISQTTAFNDASTHMAFTVSDDMYEFLGVLPWWMGHASTPVAAEHFLRTFLEHLGVLPPVTFPGNHYIVDFNIITGTYPVIDGVWTQVEIPYRMLLSQPAVQGEGGIWTVERWGMRENPSINRVFPQTDDPNMSLRDYYAASENAVGRGEWSRMNPLDVAQQFMSSMFWDYSLITAITPVPAGTFDPLNIMEPLEEHQRPQQIAFSWPQDHFDPYYIALRQHKIEEVGLAFNEVYHFRMDDGRYALITGWRPLLSRDELARYIPQWDVPEQIGDFRLVGVTVNDELANGMRISENPIPFRALERFRWFGFDWHSDEMPFYAAFTLDMVPRAFYAVYVNSSGQYVGMGVFPAGSSIPSERAAQFPYPPHSTIDALQNVIFFGEDDMYNLALFECNNLPPWQRVVELAKLDFDALSYHYWGWFNTHGFHMWSRGDEGLRPASRAELEELIRIFNPAALLQEFDWALVLF